jgi:hypothetical protein
VGVTNTHTLTASNLAEASNVLTATDSLYLNGYGIYSTHGFKCATISNLDTTVFAKGISATAATIPLLYGNIGIGEAAVLKLCVYSGVGGAPANTGTTETYGAVRVRGVDNGVLDIGEYAVGTGSYWIQVSDKTDLSAHYNLSLQPLGGNVRAGGDVLATTATKGYCLLDASTGHYWRVTVKQDGTGGLVTTDVGATP